MYIQEATSWKKLKAEQRVKRKKQTDRKKQHNKQKNNKELNTMREQRNKGSESLEVSPQALDQSKREPLKEAINWSLDLSMSSKVRQFRSLQIHHIRHNGAKFQMLEECFPN